MLWTDPDPLILKFEMIDDRKSINNIVQRIKSSNTVTIMVPGHGTLIINEKLLTSESDIVSKDIAPSWES